LKQAPAKHIVVVKPGALGDTLLLAPALRAVREARGGAKISVIGTQPNVEMLRALGVADEVVSFDRYDLFGTAQKRDPVDGAEVMSFLGEPPANCEDPFIAKGARCAIWKASRPSGESLHAVEYLHGCISEIVRDIAPLSKKPFAVEPLKKAPVKRPYAVIAPGAGGPGKRVPFEKFVSIAREIARKGIAPLFVAGEVEVENGFIEEFPAEFEKLISPGLPHLAQILAGAEQVYAHGSGVGHLAALVGADTRVFFGPTNPEVWKPWGERVTVMMYNNDSARRNCGHI